jgi:hypothetical protein
MASMILRPLLLYGLDDPTPVVEFILRHTAAQAAPGP